MELNGILKNSNKKNETSEEKNIHDVLVCFDDDMPQEYAESEDLDSSISKKKEEPKNDLYERYESEEKVTVDITGTQHLISSMETINCLLTKICKNLGIPLSSVTKVKTDDRDEFFDLAPGDVYDGLLIGDETLESLDTSDLSCVWGLKKIAENGCNLSRAIQILDENYVSSMNLAIIRAFHYEFVTENEGFQRVVSENPVSKICDSVKKTDKELKKKYPNLHVIWIWENPTVDFLSHNTKLWVQCEKDGTTSDEKKKILEASTSSNDNYKNWLKNLGHRIGNDPHFLLRNCGHDRESTSKILPAPVLTKLRTHCFEKEATAYTGSKVFLLGSEQIDDVVLPESKLITKVSLPQSDIGQIIDFVEQMMEARYIGRCTKLLMLMPFHYTIMKGKTTNSISFVNGVISRVELKMKDWKKRLPGMKVIWMQPYDVNFEDYVSFVNSNDDEADLSLQHQKQVESNVNALRRELELTDISVFSIEEFDKDSFSQNGYTLSPECCNALSEKVREVILAQIPRKDVNSLKKGLKDYSTASFRLSVPKSWADCLISRLDCNLLFGNQLSLKPNFSDDVEPGMLLDEDKTKILATIDQCLSDTSSEYFAHIQERIKNQKVVDPWTWKIERCIKEKCVSEGCMNYHNEDERRRCPIALGLLDSYDAIRPEMCSTKCHLADTDCNLCHNDAEMKFAPQNFLNETCKCNVPNNCAGAHESLRLVIYGNNWKDTLQYKSINQIYTNIRSAVLHLYKFDLTNKDLTRVMVITPAPSTCEILKTMVKPLPFLAKFPENSILKIKSINEIDEEDEHADYSQIKAIFVVYCEQILESEYLEKFRNFCGQFTSKDINRMVFLSERNLHHHTVLNDVFQTTFVERFEAPSSRPPKKENEANGTKRRISNDWQPTNEKRPRKTDEDLQNQLPTSFTGRSAAPRPLMETSPRGETSFRRNHEPMRPIPRGRGRGAFHENGFRGRGGLMGNRPDMDPYYEDNAIPPYPRRQRYDEYGPDMYPRRGGYHHGYGLEKPQSHFVDPWEKPLSAAHSMHPTFSGDRYYDDYNLPKLMDVNPRTRGIGRPPRGMGLREQGMSLREQEMSLREKELEAREMAIKMREMAMKAPLELERPAPRGGRGGYRGMGPRLTYREKEPLLSSNSSRTPHYPARSTNDRKPAVWDRNTPVSYPDVRSSAMPARRAQNWASGDDYEPPNKRGGGYRRDAYAGYQDDYEY